MSTLATPKNSSNIGSRTGSAKALNGRRPLGEAGPDVTARASLGEASSNVKSLSNASNWPSESELAFNLLVIHRVTSDYLARLSRAVEEGRAVDEANNYLRWLQFSGICRLLERCSDDNPEWRELRKKADDLQALCRPHLQGQNIPVSPSLARVDEINNKLDYMLSMLPKQPSQPIPEKILIAEVVQ